MLDRKLHRVVLASDSARFGTATSLAHAIEEAAAPEFTYVRNGRNHVCGWPAIRRYVAFSIKLGLLNENMECTSQKSNVRAFASFQAWAGDLVMQFAQANALQTTRLQREVLRLVQNSNTLPTTNVLYDALHPSGISQDEFAWLLTLQSLLRPATLQLCRRWLWIPQNTFAF